jgi:glycosyltransferase involved in cell wall biosynthesis
MKNQTICLNMIVKNEAGVMSRSLTSIRRLIDYWVIVDTGSTDGTQVIIKKLMEGIPGQLFERPWVHFAHNRNEALRLARGKTDYILFMDADEEFVFFKDFAKPVLDRDFYFVLHRLQDNEFQRISIINQDPEWSWKGVIHEAIDHPRLNSLSFGVFQNAVNIYHETGGNRAKDPDKCIKDAEILEKAIANDPANSRYVFYLAQSYFESCQYEKALITYQKRAAMKGSDQEKFWSLYRIAIIQEFHLKREPAVFIKSYATAYECRPTRIEPLYYIASYFFKIGQYKLHYYLSKIALEIPPSDDTIIVERWMRDWGLIYQLLQSAYNLGHYQESLDLTSRLLERNLLPVGQKETLQKILPLIQNAVLRRQNP